MLGFIFGVGFLSLGIAGYFAYEVLRKDKGSPAMQAIANAIRIGSEAFLKRQYKTISVLSLLVAACLFLIYAVKDGPAIGFLTAASFLFGAASSGVAGLIGMWVSIRANLRTASAATRSYSEALITSFRGGAVPGLTIVALSMMGLALLYALFLYGLGHKNEEIPYLLVGYGLGASFVALFAQLGGGIYTKAADVGADLVGKLEANIPEDDPRNPAVIADLVGDNVGDCAGRGADLFESTAAENIGAMILGASLYPHFGVGGLLLPLLVQALGLLASIVGIFSVKVKHEQEAPMTALNRGYLVTSVLAALFLYFPTMQVLHNIWFYFSGLIGIFASFLMVAITIYYTESKYRPVRTIAINSQTGAATNIIAGFAMALECTALPVLVISISLVSAYQCGMQSGIPNGGIFGTAMATMGMLSICGYVLAMDTFGPITDNAGGIVEMSHGDAKTRSITDKLDTAGNTTKALTKGYAIGSAALASFLLFSAYLEEMTKYSGGVRAVIDMAKVTVFVGALLGAMLPFLFSAFAIRAVSEAAIDIVNEVRRQFKNIPGLMQGTGKPDYAACVDIATRAALKKMVLPGLLVLGMTVGVGLILRAEATAAYLMVGTISGILLALFMNTGGGAWDNAKKYIEGGALGGKGGDAHRAAVVGDTLGDPLKDTAGPSLHVLIKLIGTISLVLAPIFM